MAEKQILSLKPAPRFEKVGDEYSERVQDRKHRFQECDDSALRCDSSRMEFSESTGVLHGSILQNGRILKDFLFGIAIQLAN